MTLERRNTVLTLACLGAIVPGVLGGADASHVRHVASNRVTLDFELADSASVRDVELWLSRDGGWCWESICVDRQTPTSLVFSAPHDGVFELYLVLRNEIGESLPPPVAGDPPHATVVVDTSPPLFQLHGQPTTTLIDGVTHVRQRLTLIDEHLGRGAVRLFYADLNGEWRDGGPASVDPEGGAFDWTPPADAVGRPLRALATDLAGNRAAADMDAVAPLAVRVDARE